MKSKLEGIVKRLDERGPDVNLMPTSIWNAELEQELSELDWRGLEGDPEVIALMAGLHLRNDSLHTSHSYAQKIEFDSTGAYWHGIMHRMEGDFANAKYWFSRAGNHAAITETARQVAVFLQVDLKPDAVAFGQARQALHKFRDDEGWDPFVFTDLVEWQRGREDEQPLQRMLRHIQYFEIRALFRYTLEACSSQIQRLSG